LADKEYAVDEYLKNLSKNKAELISQFEDLMKPQEVQKIAGTWRQALDNKSKDIIFNNGVEVVNDLDRQNVVRDLYSIGKKVTTKDSKQKDKLWDRPSFKQVGHKYILTVPLKEKDVIGRQSSVVSWGEGPPNKQNIINELKNVTKGVSPVEPIEDLVNNIQYNKFKHITSKYKRPIVGGGLLGLGLLGYGGKKLYDQYKEKTAKVQDEVDAFHNTKDYKLVMKNIASPKFRKLLIQASDDPRFHNFLNNVGKHNSGREKEKHQVESTSKKNTVYDVKLHKDGSYTCSCPNYLYRRGPDNVECKHIVGLKGKR
jgi:predicted nucleic acid-binding Zn finger protein